MYIILRDMIFLDKMINMDIIFLLWYCIVREDIFIYRYYLFVFKCDISM